MRSRGIYFFLVLDSFEAFFVFFSALGFDTFFFALVSFFALVLGFLALDLGFFFFADCARRRNRSSYTSVHFRRRAVRFNEV